VVAPVFVFVRGEFLGVMFLGAGNFERADCTRSSIFCILPLRFRIWSSESERGRASVVPKVLGLALIRGLAGGFIARTSEVVRLLEVIDGPLEWRGGRVLCIADCRGVLPSLGLQDGCFFVVIAVCVRGVAVAGTSESGGEGGVAASDAVLDFARGVEAVGDEGVKPLISLVGLFARKLSIAGGLGLRERSLSAASSANRNFSNVISFSTFNSDSSSRNLCVSIRNVSRSCSPDFNSSSRMTLRSTATLYLLSISSRLDSLFLACRS